MISFRPRLVSQAPHTATCDIQTAAPEHTQTHTDRQTYNGLHAQQFQWCVPYRVQLRRISYQRDDVVTTRSTTMTIIVIVHLIIIISVLALSDSLPHTPSSSSWHRRPRVLDQRASGPEIDLIPCWGCTPLTFCRHPRPCTPMGLCTSKSETCVNEQSMHRHLAS